MSRSDPPQPMMARTSGSGSSARSSASLLRADAEPDAVADRILELLGEDRYQSARRMAIEARARFPEHRRLSGVWRIFDKRANAVRSHGTRLSRSEEFDWLRNPPDSARGKWVALAGKELVAAADTLAELVESLKSLSLPKPPLVHQLD